MAEAVSYEEQRRRQVEANKRKLEELQLHHLYAVVREATAAVKPSPVSPNCLVKPRSLVTTTTRGTSIRGDAKECPRHHKKQAAVASSSPPSAPSRRSCRVISNWGLSPERDDYGRGDEGARPPPPLIPRYRSQLWSPLSPTISSSFSN